VGALHAVSAEPAAHASAQRVKTSCLWLDVLVRGAWHSRLHGAGVALRALLDHFEQLPGDDRLVCGLGAPHPLGAGADLRAAGALVVASPHVEAGVLRVSQDRVDHRPAPGTRQAVLVLAVGDRRREAFGVAVELLADFPEAEQADAVVLEEHHHDRGAHGVDDEPVLVLAFAGLARVGVRVLLELVAVWCAPACVPALAD
jgi:hypothetical protein